jgi:hypothetical protein
MANRNAGSDGVGTGRGGGGPGAVCWRCRDAPEEFQEVAHPDPTVDGRVRVCATGCWLPESATYRCHECDENLPRDRIRLVRDPTRADLRPECLACNRAVLRGTGSD